MWWWDEHQLRALSQFTVLVGREPSILCKSTSSFCARIAKLSISFSSWIYSNITIRVYLKLREIREEKRFYFHTWPRFGWLNANPTISKQSACRMQRRVHGVNWDSHWYNTILKLFKIYDNIYFFVFRISILFRIFFRFFVIFDMIKRNHLWSYLTYYDLLADQAKHTTDKHWHYREPKARAYQ